MFVKEPVTRGPGNNQLLYFTSTSLLCQNKGLVFISDRTGSPNLYWMDLETGEERALTAQSEGCLYSYVYFDESLPRGGKGQRQPGCRTGELSIICRDAV